MPNIKHRFRPAEPVSYRWYNAVAEFVNNITKPLKRIQGYDASVEQAMRNDAGTIKWVDKATTNDDLKSISGYDDTKDQVLVNNQGTLKWITLNDFTCP